MTSLCFGLMVQAATAQDPSAADFAYVDAHSRGGFGGGRGGGAQITVSPDGKTLAWVGASLERGGQPGLWFMPSSGGAPHLVDMELGPRGMLWSPDGTQIAFQGGRGQIWTMNSEGKGGKKVFDFSGQMGSPEWSPDGKSMAFLAIENPTRVSGATQPFKPQTGVVGTKADVQRLAVVDMASGHMHWASPSDIYVYEFGWSADSRELAVTAAKPPGENNWWTAQLYAADATTGILRLVAKPEFQMNEPRWSPDGKWIAYIGGVMSDFGSVGGDIYVAPASGGTPKDVTPGHKGSPNWIQWLNNGTIAFGETVEGETAFGILDPQNGHIKPIWRGAANVSGGGGRGIAISADGQTVAATISPIDHGPEMYAGSPGHLTQISHWSASETPTWGEVKSIHWKSAPFDVQGWLVAPLHVEPGKKYPMIVEVHGGPAAANTGGRGTGQGAAFWSQAGYYVFMPNPRGSYGEGEAFTKGNRKDFGYGDFRDIMAGVDKVIATEQVDPNRLGLTGGSYGGYMTMWGVTQTNRFKGAVAVAGIANWKSYYGENSIDEWMIPFFGATVYDDPAVYAKSSPIEFIKHVKTPTLVAVGEFDGECPPPQSYEFWHALTVLGIKTELLVYPGEGHGVRQPDNRRDLQARELAWFNYYLRG